MSNFQPPPTFALPVIVDEKTKIATFNPIWLRWFLDLEQFFDSLGGATFNPTVVSISNQVFGEKGLASTNSVRRVRNDAQVILANQVFGD